MHALQRTIVGALCLSFAGLACAAGGTQRIASHGGTCQMTVPADWKTDELLKSLATSPDGSMSALISTAHGSYALSVVKPIITAAFPPVQTFENSSQRLWFAYASTDSKRKIGWYVGVPGKAGVCGAHIAFKHAAQAALVKQIALSVKPSA